MRVHKFLLRDSYIHIYPLRIFHQHCVYCQFCIFNAAYFICMHSQIPFVSNVSINTTRSQHI